MNNLELKLFKLIKHLTFLLTRIPVIDFDKKINRYIDGHTQPQDIEEYRKCSTSASKCIQIIVICLYFAYSIKNAIVPILAYSLYDYSRPENSLKRHIRLAVNPQSSTIDNCYLEECISRPLVEYEFSCLNTNCSSIIEGHQLLDDLVKLSLFGLCHPKFEAFFSPLIKLDVIGLFFFGFTSFVMVFLGCMPIVYQLVVKSSINTIFFIAAPKLTRQMVKSAARKLLADFYSSFQCYEQFVGHKTFSEVTSISQHRYIGLRCVELDSPASNMNYVIISKDKPVSNQSYYPNTKLKNQPQVGSTEEICQEDFTDQRDQFIEAMIEDCLPLSRSYWWQTQLVSLMIKLLCLILAILFGSILIALAELQRKIYLKQDLYKEYQLQMELKNCSIWLNHMEPSHGNLIRLDEIDFGWTMITAIELALFHLIILFSCAILMAYVYLVACEITVWRAEIRSYLTASLLFLKFQNGKQKVKDNIFRLDCLKGAMKQTIIFKYNVLLQFQFDSLPIKNQGTPTNLDQYHERILNQDIEVSLDSQFDSSRLENWPNERVIFEDSVGDEETSSINYRSDYQTNVENLEKVYIQFRLFMDQVRYLSQVIELLLASTYIANYGSLILCALCIRNIKGFVLEPLGTLIGSFLISNGMMLLISNWNANAVKIIPFIWSMIAYMSSSENRRIQHLRSLWLKQIQQLERGIELVAFGIQLTYVSNIQLFVGTLTVLLLVVRPPEIISHSHNHNSIAKI